jgi:predicted nucleic acid-binding protein
LSDRILIDTGPVVAILSASDQYHEMCTEQLQKLRGPLLTCWPVVTEAAWLLRGFPRAVRSLLSSFKAAAFQLASLDEADLPSITAILAKYRDLGIQHADAALVRLASREGIGTVFTLDRRDFGVLATARGKKLHTIP